MCCPKLSVFLFAWAGSDEPAPPTTVESAAAMTVRKLGSEVIALVNVSVRACCGNVWYLFCEFGS